MLHANPGVPTFMATGAGVAAAVVVSTGTDAIVVVSPVATVVVS
jgi:hypothetical protein